MKINCAGIVTYNPNLGDLKKNIEAIYPQVNDLYIIDNNSANLNEMRELLLNYNNVSLILFDKNYGVAKALNKIIDLASANFYDWVLLLDQDSVCDNNIMSIYYAFLQNNNSINIALLTPYIIDINKMSLEEYKRLKQSDYSYVNFAITSGSLINVNICQQLGGFDNMLFIDCVDLDYSKKVEIEGYKQIRINSTYLLQQVGNAEKTKIMRVHKDNAGKISIMPYYRTNHSLFRQYYMARNHIIIIKKYFIGVRKAFQIMYILCYLFAKILVEKNKIKLLKT
ncbi:glycosyltransferase, partial [uncultured Thomasclavelia sp.]|uniref:glycosyltransferase n=1 Tax=uncultured Thomasclavelia sp. TaxID=3025759 RepID=UPI00280A7452